MNRSEYLCSVKQFVDWLRLRVSGVEPFQHRYTLRCYDWICNSLWEAHKKYSWRGAKFDETQSIQSRLQKDLRDGIATNNARLFLDAACDVFDWGGVTNHDRLCSLGANALPAFRKAVELLDPISADTKRLTGCHMSAGWSKLYSLMIDGFPIYDGRVGAGMSYLVRRYCEDREVSTVPDLLAFRWSTGRGDRNRNPSRAPWCFGTLNTSRQWLECNLWAAWVLGAVKNEGKFGGLPQEHRLRALEAALFMIGYELPG